MPTTHHYQISGMDCADCARTLEKGVAKVPGIETCQVNFTTAKLTISGAEDLNETDVIARIQTLGYGVIDETASNQVYTPQQRLAYLLSQPRNICTLIGLVLIALAFGLQGLTTFKPTFIATFIPWLPVEPILLFYMGGALGLWFPLKFGFTALRNGQGLDMNVLMSIAAVSAFAIGEFAEGATVILLFSLGEAIEGYTMERARDSLRSLTALSPSRAIRRTPCFDCQGCRGRALPDGSGVYENGPCPWCGLHEQDVAVEDLQLGDQILVKPGERIPMDGLVRSGQSGVNQAPITGESMPVDKGFGSDVFAGSINGDGLLEIEVTHLAEDNTLTRLIHLVEEAQSQKTPTQRFIDKFARIYTPAVVAIAALIAVIPPLVFNQPFLDTMTTHGWLYRALTVLVIACPCALVIATPVAIVSGITTAARRGVLIKGGAYLEALGRLQVIAFDKTGTLTQGQPMVTQTNCVDDCCTPARQINPLTACNHCDDMLIVAAALERHSTHPLAHAVLAQAEARALPQIRANQVQNLPGQGLQGWVNNRQITIGSHTLLHTNQPELHAFCKRVTQSENNGKTTILIQEDNQLRGFLAISDPPRTTSQQALQALKTIGIQHIVMLTGDNATTAKHVAAGLTIDDIQANLMPHQKIEAIRNLGQRYGNTVAMVGDGVNDAPALAAATVGIAMGGKGSAQALETADVALMADDLTQLPFAIQLGRRTINIIRFNIWFSLLTKAIFLIAALFGLTSLWLAVFADVGTSLLVTLNGMRLLKDSRNP